MIRKHWLVNVLMWSVTAAFGAGLVACGDDDKKDDAAGSGDGCTEDCGGKGFVTTAAAGSDTVEVAFEGASEGAQYVVMPYVLGDTKDVGAVKAVNGATEEFKVTFAVSSKAGASTGDGSSKPYGLQRLRMPRQRLGFAAGLDAMSADSQADWQAYDHAVRFLFNRFNPKRGLDQGKEFWDTARWVDQHRPVAAAGSNFLAGPAASARSIESYFRSGAGTYRAPVKVKSQNLTTAAADCPGDGDELTIPADANASTFKALTIPAGAVVDGGDHCIVYISAPVTDTDKAAIAASVKEILRRYKKVIYKSELPPVGDFTFKPRIAIIDFSDVALWPSKIPFIGGFIGSASVPDEAGVPMIYMAADMSKVEGAGKDAALNKKLWHGTLAHEMQHAISFYFRDPESETTNEIGSIDEGIAHYMEDLFGYGQENFSFPKNFLGNWSTGTAGALDAVETKPLQRGAAQTFIYYLVGQKGGITFTDGIVSGGGGLDFIRAVVASPASGTANLSEKFAGNWVETLGNFFGALALDGSKVEGIEEKYLPQETQTILDLNGNKDKTYGMKFNGFGGLPDMTEWAAKAESTTTTEEMSFYSTTALLYTVKDPAAKLVFKASQLRSNTAVSVVRIK